MNYLSLFSIPCRLGLFRVFVPNLIIILLSLLYSYIKRKYTALTASVSRPTVPSPTSIVSPAGPAVLQYLVYFRFVTSVVVELNVTHFLAHSSILFMVPYNWGHAGFFPMFQ